MEMIGKKVFIFLLYCIHVCYCNWIAEWMYPVQEQLKEPKPSFSRRMMDDDVIKMVEVKQDTPDLNLYTLPRASDDPGNGLKAKLEETLSDAEELIDKLQIQIANIEQTERRLKDAIVNGKSGQTAVTVTTFNQPPRSYLIKDGIWSLCSGVIQLPIAAASPNLFTEIFSSPRCIGQETATKRDPCAFNSLVKYETVPERRQLEYVEESFFCFKPVFNHTVEQFLSVPKDVVSKTCKDGVVRSLADNLHQCGMRVVTEYNFYPQRSLAAGALPLEYCEEEDGSCKLIMAWHVSNDAVENFDFLKTEKNFKKYFMTVTGSDGAQSA